MTKRFPSAKSFDSVSSILAGVPTKAFSLGQKARRLYQSSYGPWDAEFVDHVFSEVQRFLDSGDLSASESAILRWNRALQNWEIGRFDDAILDAELAFLHYDGIGEGRISNNIKLSIGLMRSRRPPSALIDFSSSLG
jgi:hypothetical protein